MIQQLTVSGLTFPQCVFRLFTLCDIANDAPESDRVPIRVFDQSDGSIQVAFGAIDFEDFPVKSFRGFTGFVYLIKGLVYFLCIFGTHILAIIHARHGCGGIPQ